MVRGENGKSAVCKAFPDDVAVGLALPWWGRAYAFCAFETGLVEILFCEEEVLWAGFCVDG